MKFRRLVIVLIVAAAIVCYFTKPTKEDFVKYIQPTISRTNIPPVVEVDDKFLYSKIIATYVNMNNPVTIEDRLAAPAIKEEYIGVFNRFWRINNP